MKDLKEQYYLVIRLWLERNVGAKVEHLGGYKFEMTTSKSKTPLFCQFVYSGGKSNWSLKKEYFNSPCDTIVVYHPNISPTKEDLIIFKKDSFIETLKNKEVKYKTVDIEGVKHIVLGGNAIDKFLFAKRLKVKDD